MSKLVIFVLILLLFVSCSGETDQELLRQAEILYEEGKIRQSAETIDKIVDQGGGSELVYYYGACTWALEGERDKALDYLEMSVEAGWMDKELFNDDKDLESLRTEPRYQEIMAKLDRNLEKIESRFPDEHLPLEIITLPDPSYDSETSIESSLKQRRSRRSFKEETLDINDVSQILWAAYGITRLIPDGPDFLRGGLKTAPSAGALYPLELYAVIRNVTGLEQGIYKYRSEDHSLVLLSRGDVSGPLARAALDQPWVEEAAFNIVYSAVFSRTTDKYGDRGRERYVCMDLGHSAENIYLQCESLNLGTVAIGAFIDINLKSVIGMTKEEEPLYIMPIGRKAD